MNQEKEATTAPINRHERISHFYDFSKRNAAGELIDDSGKTLLEALEFPSYRSLGLALAGEFTKKELDWKKLGAGSSYPVALPIVLRFLVEPPVHAFDLIIAVTRGWKQYTNEEKVLVFKNFERIFGKPELAQKGENAIFCRFIYRLFLRAVRRKSPSSVPADWGF